MRSAEYKVEMLRGELNEMREIRERERRDMGLSGGAEL
jgi:hypothetical protein